MWIALTLLLLPSVALAHEGPFPFGTFSLPAGWRWVRLAEGDDMSGELRDEQARAVMTYDMVAFARVASPCTRAAKSLRGQTISGVRVTSCERPGEGRLCFSFERKVVLCTIAGAPPFDARAFVRSLRR